MFPLRFGEKARQRRHSNYSFTVHLKVAPLKFWLKWLQQTTHQRVWSRRQVSYRSVVGWTTRMYMSSNGSGAAWPNPSLTGAPTAWRFGHQVPGLPATLRYLSSAPCRRRPLTSNLSPHERHCMTPLAYRDVLAFWCEEISSKSWWLAAPDFDELVLKRFAKVLQAATVGQCFTWRNAPSGRLAEIATDSLLRSESRQRLLQWMENTSTGPRRLRAGLPADWRSGNKTGTGRAEGTTNKCNDVAIAFPPRCSPIIVAAYFDSGECTAQVEARHEAVLAEVGKIAGEWAIG